MTNIEILRTYNAWRRDEVGDRTLEDFGITPKMVGEAIDALINGYVMQRDALEHIEVTCQRSRTSTRRLRWIEQRARYALDGKAYSDTAFDLPKDATSSAEKLKIRVAELEHQLEQLRHER